MNQSEMRYARQRGESSTNELMRPCSKSKIYELDNIVLIYELATSSNAEMLHSREESQKASLTHLPQCPGLLVGECLATSPSHKNIILVRILIEGEMKVGLLPLLRCAKYKIPNVSTAAGMISIILTTHMHCNISCDLHIAQGYPNLISLDARLLEPSTTSYMTLLLAPHSEESMKRRHSNPRNLVCN